MSSYIKQMTCVLLTLSVTAITGCGGDDNDSIETESPLWCKSPETLTADGSACELVITACNYPEVANEIGLCEMTKEEWIDGSNDITMPDPSYVAGPGELVVYYNLEGQDLNDWGIHHWNNADCSSWADFGPDEGTSWGVPQKPDGVDANFGAYWILNVIDTPNCVNFIPYDNDAIQTQDLTYDISSAELNPTGNLYVLDLVADDAFADFVFPYPRNFASLEVPGGSSLVCVAPEVLNEAGDACIADPTELVTFVPADTTLHLRGGFNEWSAEDGSDYQFDFSDGVYTLVVTIPASADAYEFKVADLNWSEPTSFAAMETEGDVVLGQAQTLMVGEGEGENLKITVTTDTNYQFTFDASDPENPKLTVVEVLYDGVMYVKGSMNGWANTTPMTYEGDSVYSFVMALDVTEVDMPYEFKIADSNWTEATNFGAAIGAEELIVGEAKILVFGEDIAQNIKLAITTAANYKFTLDATDPMAPVVTVENAIPFGSVNLLLKGSMSEWGGVTDGYTFSYADNHYTLSAVVPAGEHAFKIADADWTATSDIAGVVGESADVVIGEAMTLAVKSTTGENADLKFELATDTFLMFDLDASNKVSPILTITEFVPYQARAMYLKGDMNGWGTDEGYVFAYELGMYTLEVEVAAGTYNFKIASDGWEDDSTIGAVIDGDALVLDEMLTATLPGNGNMSLTVDTTATLIFTVNAINPAMPVLSVTTK